MKPVILITTESYSGSGSAGYGDHTYTLSKLQGFVAKFRHRFLTGLLLVDTGLVMSHLWLRVYSLSTVSTIRG